MVLQAIWCQLRAAQRSQALRSLALRSYNCPLQAADAATFKGGCSRQLEMRDMGEDEKQAWLQVPGCCAPPPSPPPPLVTPVVCRACMRLWSDLLVSQ